MHAQAFWDAIIQDLSGKGQIRLFLQPAMAILLGVRLGVSDAKHGMSPFLFRLFTGHEGRWQLFKQSLSDAMIPLLIALAIDAVLQHLTLGRVHLLQAAVVGALLVWVPFALSRGLSNRIWQNHHPSPASGGSGAGRG